MAGGVSPRMRAYLADGEGRRFFGPGPVELLERVDARGSLRAAAAEMNMAYSKATRLVHDAEAALGVRLTERTVGGAGGGGSRLTPEGRELVRRYRALEAACSDDLEKNYAACFSGFGSVPKLGCVVMASGEGRRFGGEPGSKLTADLAGAPVLERTLGALPADMLDVVVVTPWEAAAELCDGLGVAHVAPAGPLVSDTVHAGLSALGDRAGCIFVTGDQPLLQRGSVVALACELQGHPDAIVRLAWQGHAGNPVAWPADLLGALAGLEGDVGGISLLSARPELRGRVRLVEAKSPWELADVDTVDDLAALAGALEDERSGYEDDS